MSASRDNDQLEHALITQWLESSNTGLCAADEGDRVVMLNNPACRLLDIKHLNALDRPLRYLFSDAEDSAALIDWLGSDDADERHVARPGTAGRIHLLLKKQWVRHATGERFKLVAMTDVSALREAQQQLEVQKRNEAQYRSWQALNAGVLLVDAVAPDMPIVYVNPEFVRMTGYPADEVLGRNCRFLQGSERDQPALGNLRNAMQTGSSGYAVLRNYRKDGEIFINELFISPISDSSGRVIQFVGILHLRVNDISLAIQ